MHLSPGRVALARRPGTRVPADSAPLRLTVAGGPEPASGLVALDVPPGLVVEPAGPAARCGTSSPAAASPPGT